jgi:hypothetical protein
MPKSTLLRAACVAAGLLLGLIVRFVVGIPIGVLPILSLGAGGYAVAEAIDRKKGITQRECDAVDPWKKPAPPEDKR